MDIPRLTPTVTARLRVDDVLPPTQTAAAAPTRSTTAVDTAWEKTFETQRAAALATTMSQNGRLSTAHLATPTYDSYRTQSVLAAAATSTPEPTISATASTENLLPLNQIAQEPGLLNRADVHFDANSNRWSAEWPSPSPFHYGMVLKPTLIQYLKEGQSFTFQNGSDQVQTIANQGGNLVIGNHGKETVLDSQGLKHLLQSKVKSNGFELYLTQRGSLILATTGSVAKAMALAQ